MVKKNNQYRNRRIQLTKTGAPLFFDFRKGLRFRFGQTVRLVFKTMKRNHKEIERAKALEKHKKDLKNKIGKIELSYLCRLGLLYFEIKPKHKPTFVDMVVFSRTKPSPKQMIRWLKKYNEVLIVKK